MELNKRQIAARKRVASQGKDYMSNLAKKRHAKLTKEQRTAHAKMMLKVRYATKQ